MTSSTKWMVAIFAVVAAFAVGMFLTENVASVLDPSNIIASFDGLPESGTATASSGQLTLPGAGQGAAGVPKPLPSVVNNLLLNPGGGNVGIGTFDPQQLLHLSSSKSNLRVDTTSDVDNSGLQLRRSRAGTTQVEFDDKLGGLSGRGFDGTNFKRAAGISFRVDGEPGLADMPGRIQFGTTPDGSADPVERMRIDNEGNVGIGTTSPTSLLTLESDDPDPLRTASITATTIDNAEQTRFIGKRARVGPSIVQEGDNAVIFRGQGFDGVRYRALADIRVRVDGTPGVDDMPGRIEFKTTPDNTDSSEVRMTIKHTGNVGIGERNPQRILHINSVLRLEPRVSPPTSEALGDLYVDDSGALCFFSGLWINIAGQGSCS